MPIDWAATGAMLTGIGTIAGAGSIIGAALLGKKAASNFREQKQAEREMEFAERALAVAYKLQSAFDAIRSPMSSASDLESAEGELKDQDWFVHLANGRKKQTIQANVFFQRVRHFEEDFDEALALVPFVRAYFGNAAGEALTDIVHCRRLVTVYAEAYAKNDFNDKSHTETIQAHIWRGWTSNDDDPVRKKIETALNVLEDQLSPVIRTAVEHKKERESKQS